jgi:hypothetical protein
MTMKTDDEILTEFRIVLKGKCSAGRPPVNLDALMDDFGMFLFGVLFAEGRHPDEAVDLGYKLIASDWMQPNIRAHNEDAIATLLSTPILGSVH